MFASKWFVLTFTWAFALLMSLGLRFWGVQHPEPFNIRPLLLFALLFGPSFLLGAWLVLIRFQMVETK